MSYMLLKIVMDSTTLSSRKDVPMVLPPAMYEITRFAIMGFVNIISATIPLLLEKNQAFPLSFPLASVTTMGTTGQRGLCFNTDADWFIRRNIIPSFLSASENN